MYSDRRAAFVPRCSMVYTGWVQTESMDVGKSGHEKSVDRDGDGFGSTWILMTCGGAFHAAYNTERTRTYSYLVGLESIRISRYCNNWNNLLIADSLRDWGLLITENISCIALFQIQYTKITYLKRNRKRNHLVVSTSTKNCLYIIRQKIKIIDYEM